MSLRTRRILSVFGLLLLVVSAGCSSVFQPSLAHTVNVYNNDYENGEHLSHNLTVLVENGDGEILYNQTYHVDDDEEGDESGKFPAKTNPETIVVILDGQKFMHEWPTPDCGDRTRSGVGIAISGDEDEPISVNGICETVSVEGES